MIGLMLMDSGMPGVRVLRRASFELIAGRVVRLLLGSMLSSVGVLFVFVVVVWVASLQEVEGVLVPVGCTFVSQGDVVDASSAQFFVNSSLTPVLLFRRRLKSVADVQQHGFTQTWRNSLHRVLGCRLSSGPCGPVCTLEPWVDWIHPDLFGFYIWVFDALGVLNDVVKQKLW